MMIQRGILRKLSVLLVLAMVLSLVPATVLAAGGTCGIDIQWELNEDGQLTLSGSGDMDNYATSTDVPWYSIRDFVKTIVIGDGITSIGDRAFYGCTNLKDVLIGNDVATVGTYAFRGCSAVTSITLPESVTRLDGSAFRFCNALTFVRLEGNAPVLGSYVFGDGAASRTLQYLEGSTGYDVSPWTEFTQIIDHAGTWVTTVAPTCTTDGSRSIDCTYCQATFTEVLPGGHQYVNDICSVCGDTVALIYGSCGDNATWELDAFGTLSITGSGSMRNYSPYFSDGTYQVNTPWYPYRQDIKKIIIHNGITAITTNAFWGCSNLTSVTIPESLVHLGYNAFSGCESLEDVYISDFEAWCHMSVDWGASNPMYYAKNLYLNGTLLTDVIIPDSVTVIGLNAFYGCSSLTSITIPDSVTRICPQAFAQCTGLTHITIPDSVTEINHHAFRDCSSLISVIIPDSVTKIDKFTFSGCSSLTDITIPDSVTEINLYAFSGCSSLTDVTIPGSVKSIGNNAFADCTSLTNVTILDGLITFGNCVFSGCSSLTEVTIPDSVTSLGYDAFRNCDSLEDVYISDLGAWCQITFGGWRSTPMYYAKNLYLNNTLLTDAIIPEGVTHIGDYAFWGCSNLTSVTIPESVTKIGHYAFRECSGLTEVTIGDGVTSIGDDAFRNCSNLTDITLPESMNELGDYVFSGCSRLESITIPDGVTRIGEYAFSSCHSLSRVTIPDSVTKIENRAFTHCINLSDITIPESVTTIGDAAFSNCTSLPGVVIPDGVTEISYSAFIGCSSLSSVTIPDSVTTIGEQAFKLCTELTSLTIPESVTTIGRWAFQSCSGLTDIKFLGDAPTFDSTSFYGVNATAYHPCNNATWTEERKYNHDGYLIWKGHLLTDYVYNQDATCIQDGTQTAACPHCGEEETVTAAGTATGHQMENGTCTVCGYVECVTLGGTVTSFAEGVVTLTLTGENFEKTLSTDTDSYTLEAAPGQYILTVAKANHVTRQYAVTLENGDVVLDVKILLIGDIDGNGKINIGDVAKLSAHLKGTDELTDEYQILCANVNGGSLNMGDTASLYAHIKGTKKLY